MKTVLKSVMILALGTTLASAQTMEETVSKLGAAAGKAYVAPIVSGFGTNLNAGWYHKAPPAKKFGINFEAGPIFMGTLLSGGAKTMSVSGGFRLDSATARGIANESVDTSTVQGRTVRDSLTAAIRRADQDVIFSGPTIIGSEDSTMKVNVISQPVVVNLGGGNDTTITIDPVTYEIDEVTGVLEDFADIPLPLVAPQITIGTIYGTNLTMRYLPSYDIPDIGKVKFSGFGIQHNPGVWLSSPMPVDISVGFFTQSLELGSLFKASSQAMCLNVSKTFGWRMLNVTPYGGFQLESSTFEFNYDLEVDGDEVPISFELEGENKYRATAGLSIRLFLLNLNADYNLGKYDSFSMGLMVGI